MNTLEICFLSSMIITVTVSLIGLLKVWNYRQDFIKLISSRYQWFGINHVGSDTSENEDIPTESPEFAEPCKCFDDLG